MNGLLSTKLGIVVYRDINLLLTQDYQNEWAE